MIILYIVSFILKLIINSNNTLIQNVCIFDEDGDFNKMMKMPEIKIVHDIRKPIIYLDTLVMIEFARLEKGICSNEHRQDIEELYLVLKHLMNINKIICPVGNQLQEMGMTKSRQSAREFLQHYTNERLYFPETITNFELDNGFEAILKKIDCIYFKTSDFFSKVDIACRRFKIYGDPFYNKDIIDVEKEIKYNIVRIINERKSKGLIDKDFDSQLVDELNSDLQVLRYVIQNRNKSELEWRRFENILQPIYNRIHNEKGESNESIDELLESYIQFLQSDYHHKLPAVWIRSNLWASRMQRSNKICVGDNLDTKWAGTYLPILDYAVTDNSFCDLLNTTGMAELYGTKVYSLKNVDVLLKELKFLDV